MGHCVVLSAALTQPAQISCLGGSYCLCVCCSVDETSSQRRWRSCWLEPTRELENHSCRPLDVSEKRVSSTVADRAGHVKRARQTLLVYAPA
jgi:hypothetical protein